MTIVHRSAVHCPCLDPYSLIINMLFFLQRANTYPAPRFLYSAQLPNSPGQPHITTTTTTQNGSPPTTTEPIISRLAVPTSPSPAALMPPGPTVPRIPSLVPQSAPVTPSQTPSFTQGTPPITPRTNDALNTIHRLLTRTTTYAEHFPGQRVQTNNENQKNILRLDYSLRSCVSQRPWTSESRGKYCRRIPMSPRMEQESDNVSEADSDGLGDSDGVVFTLLKGAELQKGGVESHNKKAGSHEGGAEAHKGMESHNEESEQNDPISQNRETMTSKDTNVTDLVKIKRQGGSNMVDSSTQTEEEYFSYTATPNAPLPQLSNTTSTTTPQLTASQPPQPQSQAYKLPQVGPTQSAKKVTIPLLTENSGVQPSLRPLEASKLNKLDASQLVRFPSAKRPLSAFIDSLPVYNTMLKPQHTRSYSADASYPPHIRTAQATKRLMTLYNGFNRSEVMRKFHEQYPERAPDLREYSIREGKRHVICGSHAYYFH